jgi:tetratricopeptide (TPR) repeat protein
MKIKSIKLLAFILLLINSSLLENKLYSQNKETKSFVDDKFKTDILAEANAAATNKRQVDSLNKVLLNQKPDTSKIKTYIKLIDLCETSDNLNYTTPVIELADKLLKQTKDSLTQLKIFNWRWSAVMAEILYYKQIRNAPGKELSIVKQHVELCEKYNNPVGVTDGYLYAADYYFKNGEMLQKLKMLQEGYEVTKKMNFKRGMSRFTLQTAFFYADNNDSAQVVSYLEKGEVIEKEINDNTRNNRGYFIRGRLYASIKNYEKALLNFNKAIDEYTKSNERKDIPGIYYEIGKVYKQKGEFNKAISYFEKCETLCHETGDMSALAKALVAKGNVFALQKNYIKAIETHKWLYDLRNKASLDNTSIVFFGSGLAKDYFLNKEYKNAKEVSDNVLKNAYSWGVAVEKLNAEETAYKIDSALGNYKEAFLHYQNMLNLKNLVNNDEVKKTGIKEKFKSDLAKQKSDQEKQNLIVEEDRKKQRLILFAVSAFLLLVAILAGVIFKNLRQSKKTNQIINEQKAEVEEQKHLIEEKQKEILDSIHYAKRIQTALITSEKYIDRNLNKLNS